MRVIIAGGRDITDLSEVEKAIADSGFDITEVVCGGAIGVDALGAGWAMASGVPVAYFEANWKVNRKAAGPIRNREMAAYADALIAVWNGASRGTANMIEEATKRGLKVHVHRVSR